MTVNKCGNCKYWARNSVGEEAIIQVIEDGVAVAPCTWIRGDFVAVVTGRSPDDIIGPANLDWKASLATVETFYCNQYEQHEGT